MRGRESPASVNMGLDFGLRHLIILNELTRVKHAHFGLVRLENGTPLPVKCLNLPQNQNFNAFREPTFIYIYITHRIHGAAIYMVTWIPSI